VKSLFATISEIEQQRSRSGKPYREFLRLPAMSAGLYVLPTGATDLQRPHHEDEVYYVIRGRARFKVAQEDHEVSAGGVMFVAAGVEHHFYDVREELVVLVLFAPAES
jgi:mannose-6-phosphate isomerase-like protein (cupin superfamily)